ncbi:hypothetical protein CSOJ01_05878 [Colletotrichum sojae]|uniref:phospholipase A2 n=1 Tax=Colletotrichum sojae TaxID=2175907 RepID=A0A8H6JDM5_9PEZI|nr:hypothetical protein CSOJ01_05878 [Colletotrichum sojae]
MPDPSDSPGRWPSARGPPSAVMQRLGRAGNATGKKHSGALGLCHHAFDVPYALGSWPRLGWNTIEPRSIGNCRFDGDLNCSHRWVADLGQAGPVSCWSAFLNIGGGGNGKRQPCAGHSWRVWLPHGGQKEEGAFTCCDVVTVAYFAASNPYSSLLIIGILCDIAVLDRHRTVVPHPMAAGTRPRVLCLDGGGIRGLSEILILKELMLQVRIHSHLDRRLGKTLNECEALFRTLGSKIFEGGNLKQTLRMLSTGSKHTSKGLAEVIRGQAGNETMHDADAVASGKVPVAVVTVSKTTHDDYLFRTYGVRAGDEACPIVDACLATSAATTFFPSITINGIEYVDGAFRKNNPSSAALSELESKEWPLPLPDAVTGVECLVSVRTGRPTFKCASSSALLKVFPGVGSLKDAATLCIKIATDCEEAHRAVEDRFRKANMTDSYYRFDVDRGLEAVELNESDNEALQMISAVAKSYLKGRQTKVERCALAESPESAEQPPGIVFSGLPESTVSFLGRKGELSELRQALDPSLTGRKCSLLLGIGGSGKTQLALRHIKEEGRRYSAVIWVNASTAEYAAHDFQEAAFEISRSSPRYMPVPQSQDIDALSRVKAHLRSTAHRNWLLVIDSSEDTEQNELARYVPECAHGGLMDNPPDEALWSYEKNRVIITILDMVYRSLKHRPEDAALFNLLIIMGSWQVSTSPLDEFHLFDSVAQDLNETEHQINTLRNLFRKPQDLRLALRHLASFCLVRHTEDNNHIRTQYVMQAAHGLAGAVYRPRRQTAMLNTLGLDGQKSAGIQRDYVTPFKHAMSLISEHIETSDLDPYNGRFRVPYAFILRQAAGVHLVQGFLRESMKHFESTINYETIKASEAGLHWPRDEDSVQIMCEFSSACHKSGELDRAIEILEPVLPLSEKLLGHENETTMSIVTRLKELYMRRDTIQGHHKTALVGSLTEIETRGMTKSRHSESLEARQNVPEDEEASANQQELINAARSGDTHTVQLKRKLPTIRVNKNIDGWTPLGIAAREGHVDVVKHLLEAGANIEQSNVFGSTPLFIASDWGKDAIVRLLLQKGADVEAKSDIHGRCTPLLCAAARGHIKCIKVLIDHGADIRAVNDRGSTALMLASEHDHKEAVKQLMKCGLDTTARDFRGRTLLHCAARGSMGLALEFLLEKRRKTDINAQGSNGDTPLHEACRGNHSRAVELLVAAGARCDIRSSDGRTPCEIAHIMGFEHTDDAFWQTETYKKDVFIGLKKTFIEVVLSESLDVLRERAQEATAEELNTPSDVWHTTSLLGAFKQGLEYANVLLEAGANPDGADCWNQAPMHKAIDRDDYAMARVLAQYGAEVETSPYPPLTLWEYAWKRRSNIASLLLRRGVSIKEGSVFMQEVLYSAAAHNDKIVAKRLVEAGALITLRLDGRSAVDIAFLKKSNKILDCFASLDDDLGFPGAASSAGPSGGA